MLDYLKYIKHRMAPESNNSEYTYSKLLDHLHTIPYIPNHDLDINRVKDVQILRYDYYSRSDGYQYLECPMPTECSFLEMLAALSIRAANDLLYKPGEEYGESFIFWECLEHLGLLTYTDYGAWSFITENEVQKLVFESCQKEVFMTTYDHFFDVWMALGDFIYKKNFV